MQVNDCFHRRLRNILHCFYHVEQDAHIESICVCEAMYSCCLALVESTEPMLKIGPLAAEKLKRDVAKRYHFENPARRQLVVIDLDNETVAAEVDGRGFCSNVPASSQERRLVLVFTGDFAP